MALPANPHPRPLSQKERGDSVEFFRCLELSDFDLRVGRMMLQQVRLRLGYLESVGLGYLTLDRTIRSLSGGEARRVALTSALGSSLVNMLYVLDEPSIGLHPRDVGASWNRFRKLRDRANTVVVVEHEEAMIRAADQVIEIGPGAGAGRPRGVPGHARRDGGIVPEFDRRFPVRTSRQRRSAARRQTHHGWIRLAGRGAITSKTSPSSFRWACSAW